MSSLYKHTVTYTAMLQSENLWTAVFQLCASFNTVSWLCCSKYFIHIGITAPPHSRVSACEIHTASIQVFISFGLSHSGTPFYIDAVCIAGRHVWYIHIQRYLAPVCDQTVVTCNCCHFRDFTLIAWSQLVLCYWAHCCSRPGGSALVRV